MKLLYFAIEGYCHTKGWREFNLDSNWRFERCEVGGGMKLHVTHRDVLPDGFFSELTNPKDAPVESVSVLVGGNGSGKTSFASCLADALKYNSAKVDADLAMDYLPIRQFVAVTVCRDAKEKKSVVTISSSCDIDFLKEDVRKIDKKQYKFASEQKALENVCGLIYHSPMYSFRLHVEEEEGVVKDISLRRMTIVDDSEIESQDATGCRIEGLERAMANEDKRILTFLGCLEQKKRDNPSLELTLPAPVGVTCSSIYDAGQHIEQHFPSLWRGYDGIEKIRWLLHSNDTFARSLFIYVLDALSAPVNLGTGDFEFANDKLRKRVIDSFVGLAGALQECNETDENDASAIAAFKAAMPRPDFVAYKKIMDEMRGILDELEKDGHLGAGTFMNDRLIDHFKSGIELFGLMEERMRTHPAEYTRGELNVTLRSGDDIVLVQKLVDLHLRCRAGWSVSYLRFSFGLSTGEMSFVSLFARLNEYFEEERDNVDADEVWAPHYVLFMDETEATLHPQLQRNLLHYLIEYFECFVPEARVHLIFATHSPILLSDVPSGNCVFLDGTDGSKGIENTFGAHIFDLYRIPFNMQDGTTGAFAERRLSALIKDVSRVVKKRVKARQNGKTLKKQPELSKSSKGLIRISGDPVLARWIEDLQRGGLV